MRLTNSSLGLTLAVPLAGLVLMPGEAEACSPDPCNWTDAWQAIEPVNAAAKIPIDGVLLLRGVNNADQPEPWLDKLTVKVMQGGVEVAGTLSETPLDDILAWRPVEPLTPGAQFDVVASVTNPEEPDEYYDCAPLEVSEGFSFQADDGPMAPLLPPLVETSEDIDLLLDESLESLVCCDDAIPEESYNYCGYDYEYGTFWNEGECATTAGAARLRVGQKLTTQLPASTAALVFHRQIVDGDGDRLHQNTSVLTIRDGMFCTSIEAVNFATGEKVSTAGECHGDKLAALLGPQTLDPAETLAGKCASPLYTCAVEEEGPPRRWDEEDCTPWGPQGETETGDPDPTGGPDPTGDPDPTEGPDSTGGPDATGDDSDAGGAQDDGLVDHGCACDSDGGAPGPAALVTLAALGVLRRRRRA